MHSWKELKSSSNCTAENIIWRGNHSETEKYQKAYHCVSRTVRSCSENLDKLNIEGSEKERKKRGKKKPDFDIFLIVNLPKWLGYSIMEDAWNKKTGIIFSEA